MKRGHRGDSVQPFFIFFSLIKKPVWSFVLNHRCVDRGNGYVVAYIPCWISLGSNGGRVRVSRNIKIKDTIMVALIPFDNVFVELELNNISVHLSFHPPLSVCLSTWVGACICAHLYKSHSIQALLLLLVLLCLMRKHPVALCL